MKKLIFILMMVLPLLAQVERARVCDIKNGYVKVYIVDHKRVLDGEKDCVILDDVWIKFSDIAFLAVGTGDNGFSMWRTTKRTWLMSCPSKRCRKIRRLYKWDNRVVIELRLK